MSLLTLVQAAADRIGIVRPVSVIASQDQQTLAFLGFAQQEGKELVHKYDWQALTSEVTFTSVATETQTGILPSNFGRFVNDTFWNRTRRLPLDGPFTAQEWQQQKAVTAQAVYQAFRQRGNAVMITPTPSAGDTLAFEYITKNWCTSNTSVGQSAWTADTDTAVLDEEIFTLGVVWRFKQAKGFDYAEAFRSYEIYVKSALMSDGGKPVLNSTGRRRRGPGVVVPEGNWPV